MSIVKYVRKLTINVYSLLFKKYIRLLFIGLGSKNTLFLMTFLFCEQSTSTNLRDIWIWTQTDNLCGSWWSYVKGCSHCQTEEKVNLICSKPGSRDCEFRPVEIKMDIFSQCCIKAAKASIFLNHTGPIVTGK